MEKKIAIRGHKTRWDDVIKTLEDLGGENLVGWEGGDQAGAYFINDEGCINWSPLECPPMNESYSLYTLEEYEALQQNLKGLETNKTEIGMKYKAGDRVKLVDSYPVAIFKDWLGKVVTIDTAKNGFYTTLEICSYFLTEDMIEGLVEENINIDVVVKETTKDISDKVADTLMGGLMVGKSFNLPKGYQFKDQDGNVINATKIVLEKKKKEYPKTYEECCKELNIAVRDLDILDNMLDTTEIIYRKNLDRLLNTFRKLLICRDAYWKIAGEEMGLGKPWEPDYDSGVDKFGIICLNGIIQESNPTTNWERHLNKVLDFPTREMRDAFYENFKEDIEQCKELL